MISRKKALLWNIREIHGKKLVECNVCSRNCTIGPGMRGFCRNRVNIDGELYVEYFGVLSAVESRPIEIKPFFHYWPGSTALTFSGWGCSFRCPWCQNYHLSQRDPNPLLGVYLQPSELVEKAVKIGDEGICGSFNEPTIHLEYILEAAEEARKRGLYSTIVTNGYMSRRALEKLLDAGVDGYSIDIKGCPETYEKILAANPDTVFRNAKYVLDNEGHVEMVFLVVTKANDTWDCIEWVLSRHIELLGPETPLHVNRYYPANRWSEPPTRIDLLLQIAERAREIGIEYVYVGNVMDPSLESTKCPKCGKMLIIRHLYSIVEYRLERDKKCPRCGYRIPIRGNYIEKKYHRVV